MTARAVRYDRDWLIGHHADEPLADDAPAQVERVTWNTAMQRMDWKPGEHVTLIGPTGAGKTELTVNILRHRRWVLFLGTKRVDSTQDRLAAMGYRTITTAAALNPEIGSHFILRPPWPKKASAQDITNMHARVFRDGLHQAFIQTGWTTVVDEGRYVSHRLGLAPELELQWLQGRSQANSIVIGTQRPRFIPLEAYDQASHLFMWRDNDLPNIARISEMAGLNRHIIAQVVPNLGRHDVLYVQPFTGELFVTNTRW